MSRSERPVNGSVSGPILEKPEGGSCAEQPVHPVEIAGLACGDLPSCQGSSVQVLGYRQQRNVRTLWLANPAIGVDRRLPAPSTKWTCITVTNYRSC
jgi:hypothetical protein